MALKRNDGSKDSARLPSERTAGIENLSGLPTLARRRGISGREPLRKSPLLTNRVLGNSVSLLLIFSLCVIGAVEAPHAPVTPVEALDHGIQWLTQQRFTPSVWVELAILALALVNVRSLWLEVLAYRSNTPIELLPLDNATEDKLLDTHSLDVAFRDYLALSRLYQIPAIPGDQEPDRLIDVLKVPANTGWRGILAAVYSYTLPRRAFVISASLRTRDDGHQCGVSIQIRRLPTLAVHLDSQWSTTFERALQRAAYAVAAHIIQQTKACRSVPWSEWRRRKRAIPVSLFRDYQRAKRMVRERRYDEALTLYHRALLQDANNIGMRYDVGQLYERLHLYPDALFTYMGLVDEIFPPVSIGAPVDREQSTASTAELTEAQPMSPRIPKPPRRVSQPKWWPNEVNRDPFVIRYRYLVVLGSGSPLATALAYEQWPELSRWVNQIRTAEYRDAAYASEHELRPWRATELTEVCRLLGSQLDLLYSAYCNAADIKIGSTLTDLMRADNTDGSTADNFAEKAAESAPGESRVRRIERYLLKCAQYEAGMLYDDIVLLENRARRLRRARKSSLTSVAVKEAKLVMDYRIRRLEAEPGKWPAALTEMNSDLANTHYSDDSGNWLEHYIAACYYASAIADDEYEEPEHQDYAFAAVAALDRATRCGDVVEFVTSKKYWLQAGDPDLTGLRCYSCFRAFEARVYGHPLPATPDISRYELYLYLRTILQEAAGHFEDRWRARAKRRPQSVTFAEFEEWWRQELHAWELAIRVGRFFRQWQTRQAALEGLRNWIESFGPEFTPITFPDLTRPGYLPDVGDYSLVDELLDQTEGIFDFLGHKCGSLLPSNESTPLSIAGNTRIWNQCAAACSRSANGTPMSIPEAADACIARSAVWAALRQWAQSPTLRHERIFEDAIARVARIIPTLG